MTITASDLLAPTGEIESAFYPREDSTAVLARLQAYVEDGYRRVPGTITDVEAQDDIARAWAYYRAYNAIYLTMSRSAASKSIAGEASSTTLASQIAAFEAMRDQWYTEALSLMPDVTTSTELPGSVHSRIVPDFPC